MKLAKFYAFSASLMRWPARKWVAASVVAAAVSGCTQFPDLDAAQQRDIPLGDYPQLLPLDRLLAGPDPAPARVETAADGSLTPLSDEALRGSVTARASQLAQRSARLKARPLEIEADPDRLAALQARAAALRSE